MTKELATTGKAALAKKDDKGVEFVPFGASNPIRLSAAMVSAFIAVPTRSGKLPTERDCVRFIMLCQGKRANPFEGDCYLIGYDNSDGTATFSMVCGVDLFLKRAEQSDDYDGYEAGVIVKSGESTVERQGAMVYDGEKILGAWCKVYRKNQTHPTYKSVKFDTFNTGKSRWAKDPGGMITKVAVSQAHREAYPTALGGLYSQEEMQKVAEAGGGAFTLQEPISMPVPLPAPAQEPPAASQEGPGSTEGAPEGVEGGKGQEPPQDHDGELLATGRIEELTQKSGTNGNKAWTATSIKIEGAWYSTFHTTHAETAKQAKEMDMEVDCWFVKAGKYNNIKDILVTGKK